MTRLLVALTVLLWTLTPLSSKPAADKEIARLWKLAATPGHLVLIRHATAPGNGDPAGFDLANCATQRLLSEGGRAEARAIGEEFRDNGIPRARVYSSRWCRCHETAQLLSLGTVEPWALLNSFYGTPEKGAAQIAELRAALLPFDLSSPAVLVTHHTVIASLTGVAVTSGEIVVVKREQDGTLAVAGRIPPPAK